MMRKGLRTIASASLALVAAFGAAWPLPAEGTKVSEHGSGGAVHDGAEC